MKKSQILFFLVIVPVLFCGCFTKNVFQEQKDRNLFGSVSIGLEHLIEINGYYIGNRFQNIGQLWDTFILYDDGTYSFFNIQEDFLGIKGINLKNNIRQSRYSRTGEWDNGGIVSIHKDTIIVDTYDVSNSLRYLTRDYYKVIDRRTLLKVKSIVYSGNVYEREYNTKYYFVEADSLPPSNVYLKRKKWAWRNKEDWKAYMRKIREM